MEENDLQKLFPRLTPVQKTALKKLGLSTARDLLYHFPVHYGRAGVFHNIANIHAGEKVVLFGQIGKLKTSKGFRTKIPMGEAILTDDTGKIKIVWFNQPYLAKMIAENSLVRAEGNVSQRKKTNELYLSNPQIEKISKLPDGVEESLFGEEGAPNMFYPTYRESRGLTSNWLYHAVSKIIKTGFLENLRDPIPDEILHKYNLPKLKTALIWIHMPKNKNDAESARKRFAFEEIFLIQLERQRLRKIYENAPAPKIEISEESKRKFLKRFPFEPTAGQKKSIEEILQDLNHGHAMGRLLEGDVGSGKTLVAATASYASISNRPIGKNVGRLQVAYMAPTEILAKQHFESFISYFFDLPINIGLLTSNNCRKFPSKVSPEKWTDISKRQLLKWASEGEISILIGTHSLIQKTVKFRDLGLVIVDEQHRFGTNQRQKLARKDGSYPHFLSMTATPIPRTLALTIFGDLDLSLIEEMPSGRKPIITEIILPDQRKEIYEKIRSEINSGRQAYVICPRIDEPDLNKKMALLAKSVKEEAKRLKKEIFPEFKIGTLHGKMTSKEKEETMNEFKENKIQILVATSVVEVGVNVPNATIIAIEGAERFGLSQLHQLRGRVIRSNHQAYCYVFSESKTKTSILRLKALKTAKNGFELSEQDLKIRGAGELGGNKQWGVSDIGMEALRNLKMVEFARHEARDIINRDFELKNYPTLQAELEKRKTEEIHFE